jgi:hypothetical protein
MRAISQALFLALAVPATAQAPEAVEKANKLYQAKDYGAAATAYAALAREAPKHPLFAFRQGASLLGLGRGQEALPFFEKAESLGFPAGLMQAWSARAYARLGEKERAFATIEKAIASGFSDVTMLDGEADFAALRGDPRFARLRELADRKARPCAHGPEFRQLDFWIGDWDVTSAGATAGESRVEKMLGECVLLENWTGASGMVGKSFNLWDATTREWRQTWVDSTGGLHEYHGAFADGKMIYQAERLEPAADGKLQPTKLRMTFFDLGGTVRQLGEQSADGGRTWTVSYDLLYTRKR